MDNPNDRILVCSLGATWPVVAEAYAALAPEVCPLFQGHPDPARLARVREACGGARVRELWVVTTGGAKPQQALEGLRTWWEALGRPRPLRVWQAAKTDEVATSDELERLQELTFRVVLRAVGERGEGAILSLAGGRKTMSADLQRAGSIFGCAGLLHVVAPEPFPKGLSRLGGQAWQVATCSRWCGADRERELAPTLEPKARRLTRAPASSNIPFCRRRQVRQICADPQGGPLRRSCATPQAERPRTRRKDGVHGAAVARGKREIGP